MKMNQKMKGGFTLVELLVVIVIIAALAGLAAPMVMRQRKKADQTQATSNARQVGMALLEFNTEYNRYPDASTIESVQVRTGNTVTGTGSANAFLRQLFAANLVESEEIFFAKASYTRTPDNIYNFEAPGTDALGPGECGFAYIMRDATTGQTDGNAGRPILATPITLGANTFERDPFDSRAVVLRLDGSAVSINIDNTGNAILNGQPIFTGGPQSVWGRDITNPTPVPPEAAAGNAN